MSTFNDFKRGPGREICQRLGLRIDACLSWSDFTLAAIHFNNPTGALVDRARELDGVASSGERVLLHAVLHAADFDCLADALADGQAWKRMGLVSGPHRDAVLACIARRELI